MTSGELDQRIRYEVYAAFAASGRAPSAAALAGSLDESLLGAHAGLERLHDAHALVLDAATREVRMALPFSNRPTAYRVESGGRVWDANCAWDAVALVPLLGLEAARIVDSGESDREPRVLRVEDRALVERDGVVSFARPASRWWDDILFT